MTNKFLKKIKNFIRYCLEAFKYIILFPIGIMMYSYKDIYLISERGTDARDNGYHFFKYMNKEHPELDSYYIISQDSPDYQKVLELGNVVKYRSIKHYLMFIGAKYKISTHIMGFSPDLASFLKMNNVLPFYGKRIFLQHGIIMADLPMLYQENAKVDLFICGAKTEYDYINNYFHYKNDIPQFTGLARYDALQKIDVKNQILIMPTWRGYLGSVSENDFVESDYYKAWNGILNNREIIAICEENDITVIFYPHYQMQKYLKFFNTTSKNMILADFNHYDVQTLLKESALLITDYSSIFFDFAYMMKPTIYYQFDQEYYYHNHYKKGYFDHQSMGFGQVVEDESCIEKEVIRAIERKFQIEDIYKKRIADFFELRDDSNCQRIFQKIQKL